MESKDLIYLALMVLTAVVFFVNGFYCAKLQRARPRKLDVHFNDSGCVTELPTAEQSSEVTTSPRLKFGSIPSLTRRQIRSNFGNN